MMIALALCIIGAGIVVAAQWGPSRTFYRAVATPVQTPTWSAPGNPSKEYIYAGGRLVATEEPGGTGAPCTVPSSINLLISEFRFRGSGSTDEFVEIYNKAAAPVTVCAGDGSAGWAVAAADGTTRFVIPNDTTLPARSHYLAVGGAYSLTSYAAGDTTWSVDVTDDAGVALFKTANPASFTVENRLDAVGFGSVANALYREGTGLAPIGATNGEMSFVRTMPVAAGGLPQDTDNNAADFQFISTSAATFGGVVSTLGAPGPENQASHVERNGQISIALLDPAVSTAQSPNRVRCQTCTGTNADRGTMVIRRKLTNNTGQTITSLRFRDIDITTLNSPGYVPGGAQCDLRVLDSADTQVTLTDGSTVMVKGITLEQPPSQPLGGGLNSSIRVDLPPGGLAPGQSINVQFLLGVVQSGYFRFLFNMEADT